MLLGLRAPATLLVAGFALCPASATAQPSRVWQSAVPSSSGAFRVLNSGTRWYFSDHEAALGHDVNGDGDLDDAVLCWIDPVARTFAELPIGVFPSDPPLATGGDFELIAAFEYANGYADQNGDQDRADEVLCVRRVSTGAMTIVPLAIRSALLSIAPDGSAGAVVARESDGGVDWNGDGDLGDARIFAIDPASATVAPIADVDPSIARGAVRTLANGDVVFLQPESFGGADANGDGDMLDVVFRIRRAAGSALATVPIAIEAAGVGVLVMGAAEQSFVVRASEAGQGVDLNGDGDLSDAVPIAIDAVTLGTTSSGVAADVVRGLPPEEANRDSRFVALLVHEAKNGVDLTGDGDVVDSVPAAFDVSTGQVASSGREIVALAPALAIGDGFFGFETFESQSAPPADQNGDGDPWDIVPCVLEFQTGASFTVPIALPYPQVFTGPLAAAGSRLLIAADEATGGATDFNFDGTVDDRVAFVLDVASRRLSNLARAVATLGDAPAGGAFTGFTISESMEGHSSLNGDGDDYDAVVVVCDPAAEAVYETGLARAGSHPTVMPRARDGFVLFSVSEFGQETDFTGDGLLTRDVLVFDAPSPGSCGSFERYGHGCPTGAGTVPTLEAHGCAIAGGSIRLQIARANPAESAFLALGVARASIPLGGGCSLLVAPVFPVLVGPIPLLSNGLLSGAALLATNLPPGATPGKIEVQAFVTDASLHKGSCATNGLELEIAP